MEIKDRIRYLRKDILNLTQQEFSDALKISRSNEGNIEIGRIAVTDRVVSDICEEYNINENWLRTGEGGDDNMFLKPQKNDLVSKAAVLLGKKDPVFEAFVDTYSKLNDSNREVLLQFGVNFLNSLNTFSKNNDD